VDSICIVCNHIVANKLTELELIPAEIAHECIPAKLHLIERYQADKHVARSPESKTTGVKPERKAKRIFISLTAADRMNATAAAITCNQTVAEWISDMVNMSLKP
jgi:hypothetical protein